MRGCLLLTALICGSCLLGSAELLRDPYKVLGVARGSSESDIRKAYRQLAVRLHPDKNTASGSKAKFLELQEAYELLSNPATRARYDASGSVSGQPRRQQSQDWRFQHPSYQHHATEQIPTSTMRFTYLNFKQELLRETSPLLVQVYYDYSPVCKAAANEWEQAAKDLSQWARLGRIEWNQQYLLSNLRSFMGLAIRPDDLPVVFGFPAKCHSMACAVRHSGPLKADLLQHFVADQLLELPAAPAVDPETIDRFLARVPHHKVAVLAFSTATKASIPLRHAAEQHKHHVVAGRVQWKAEDLIFWQGKLGVQRAPSVVFLRGPGALPAVYDASNTKRLDIAKIIADNAWQVVQPLRQQTAGPLGCSWGAQAERTRLVSLCVVLIGRPGQHSLRQGRTTLAQFSEWMLNRGFLFPRSALPAAKSYSAGQLRLTWLDADTQQAFCKAHLSGVGPEVTASVCGPDWPASLFPWDVVPATAHELPPVQLLAYKPGAGQLPAWWSTPHRFSLYDATDVTTVHNHSSFTSIASWMSECLSEKQLQHTIDTPEQLADDESLKWLGIGMSWASISARWLRQQLPVDMSSLVSWESAQLLLPMLLCGLLAVCVQACSGPTSADARPGAQRRHSRPAAAAQQAGDDDDDYDDDDMQDRFLKTLWQLDTEACLFDPAVHSRLDTGSFLIMLLIRRERLLPFQTRTQHGSSPGQPKTDRVCREYLLQFAQLRQNLKEEKRMLFVIAELHALKNAAWQRFYVDAVKLVSSSCPMIVWHPKRNRCQILDCNYVQTTQHALEQTLDGNVKSWEPRPWPDSQHQ
ncbi:TPA: DnaJ subfamily C member 16 [Trebouxia sp. C0005]